MRDGAPEVLPPPSSEALAHSERLRQTISHDIHRAAESIPFSRYMERALYEPGLGYYMAGAVKLGAQGDFTTAAEASPLYGAAIGQQLQQIVARIGGGVLELGAGSGKLAQGVLQSQGADTALSYTILEPSADLALRQRQLLSESLGQRQLDRVTWINSLPEQFTGVILANEVMDALPVERFRIGEWLEQECVSASLTPHWQPASGALQVAVDAVQGDLGRALPAGYESEVSLMLKPWLNSLGQCLQRGVMLLVDYGYPRQEYYREERQQGTLACYYRHRVHYDPYRWPGLQDITAHVDFTAVAEAAVALGMDLLGYCSQSAFLLDSRLLDLAEQLSEHAHSDLHRIAIAQSVKTLTLPGEMGERFQVMALGKRYDSPLPGFRTQDLSYRL